MSGKMKATEIYRCSKFTLSGKTLYFCPNYSTYWKHLWPTMLYSVKGFPFTMCITKHLFCIMVISSCSLYRVIFILLKPQKISRNCFHLNVSLLFRMFGQILTEMIQWHFTGDSSLLKFYIDNLLNIFIHHKS